MFYILLNCNTRTLSETVKVAVTIPSDSKSALIFHVPNVGSSVNGIDNCAKPFLTDTFFH